MWLTQAAIKRPVAMAMFFIAIALLGLMAWFKLPKQLFPDTEIPIITVSTVYPGAGPDEVERLVSKPIEETVATISRVDKVRSMSRESLSLVIVQFEPATDEEAAASDVRDKVFGVLRELPDDAEQPIVQKLDITAQASVIAGAVSDQLSTRELRTLGDRTVKDRLSSAMGVASVGVGGGDVREIHVSVRQDRLAAVGMSLTDLRNWLVMQSLDLPGGTFSEGEKEFSVRVLGEFTKVDEIRQLTLSTPMGGVLRLSDLAKVTDTVEEPTTYARLNGKPSVSFSVTKSSSANVIETVDAVKARIETLERSLPGNVDFTLVRDESVFTKDSLHDLVMSLVYGVLLATLVVYYFLRNVRATIIIFFAIPTSLLATFFVMQVIGYTLNFMTMLGLALAVGILVDDSIVVLENIYRHLSMGKEPVQAAIDGRAEIGLAAVAITMTDVVVFIPIALMGGIVGKFFRPFGATVAVSTLFSLLVSFTLTPMLAARWLKRADVEKMVREEDARESAVRRRTPYVRALDFCISRWWSRLLTVFTAVVVLVAATIVLGKMLGFSFIPTADQGEFTVYVELPIDKNLEATDAVVRRVEKIVAVCPEVEAYSTDVGRMADQQGKNYGQVAVQCKELAPKFQRVVSRMRGITMLKKRGGTEMRVRGVGELRVEMQAACDKIPGAVIRVRPPTHGGAGGTNAIAVEIQGPREAGLVEVSQQVYEKLRAVPGFDADLSHKVGKPEIQAKINRKRATELGLSAAQIAVAIRTAVEGDTTLKYRERGDEFDIRIGCEDSDTDASLRVPEIVVAMRNGRPVRLRDVADVITGQGPAQLTRLSRQDLITVGIDAGGMPDSAVRGIIDRELKDMSFPAGITYNVGGSVEMMQDSMMYMLEALRISIILVFALLVVLFESWFHPFTIMLGTPMGVTGALIGLWIAGCTNSIFSMIGMIMLIGIVTKNAILLVDFTNTLRGRGLPRREALLRAGVTRMRPIVMTTLTLALSLTPISTGFGRGAEFRQGLGASVTGGVLFSMFLTLLVIPAFYCLLDDFQSWIYLPVKRGLIRLIFRIRAEDEEGEEGAGPESGPSLGL